MCPVPVSEKGLAHISECPLPIVVTEVTTTIVPLPIVVTEVTTTVVPLPLDGTTTSTPLDRILC
jgi:hypothetical protein